MHIRATATRVGCAFFIVAVSGCNSLSETVQNGPVSVDCKLPLYAVDTRASPGGTFTGGFVPLSTSQFSIDPAATVSRLDGGGTELYAASAKKWIVVPQFGAAADDVGEYAYATIPGVGGATAYAVHLVTTATGVDRSVYTGTNYGAVVGIDGATIYLAATPGVATGAGPGLNKLDSTTGTVAVISPRVPGATARIWVHRIAAWYAPGDRALYRVDLGDGHVDKWLNSQADIAIEGLAYDGSPLLSERTVAPPRVDRLLSTSVKGASHVLWTSTVDPAAPSQRQQYQVARSQDATWILMGLPTDPTRQLFRYNKDATFGLAGWIPAQITSAGGNIDAVLAGPCS